MDEARKKLRVCLICVVAMAFILGCIYYFGSVNTQDMSAGTLIMLDMENRI